jgi:endonuclease-3
MNDNKEFFISFLKKIEKNVPLDAYVSYFAKKIKNKEERLFKVIISTILSARTKDETTAKVSERLFKKVKNWKDLEKISLEEIEKLIYGVGFYKNKAKQLKKLAEKVKELNYKIPDTLEGLTKLPGIGTKTANIILAEGFEKEGLAVDTHVHRIVNRLGIISTSTPEESEKELKKLIDKSNWRKVNALLVSFGRQICNVKPKCEICFFKGECPYYKKIMGINKILKNYNFKKIKKKEISNLNYPGTYVLKIYLKENSKIKNWKLKKGFYFYIGSARMKNGLKNRISHHLKEKERLHWHIDYLTNNKNSQIKEIFISERFVEKEVAKEFLEILKYIKNFGNSDDKKNKSHLFYLEP